MLLCFALIWAACDPAGGEPDVDGGSSDGATDGATDGPSGGPSWSGTTDPDGQLPLRIRATREVVRVPASDAPPSDSETVLSAETTAAIAEYFWEVKRADTGAVVMTSSAAAPTFACAAGGRGTYDVWLRASAGAARVHAVERRLVTCTLPRTTAGRTVHTLNLSTDSTFLQQGKIKNVTVMPGDVIRVSGAGTAGWSLVGFVGTQAQPIHVINDGLVTNTDVAKLLQIVNCQHLIVDGLGSDAHPHGFVFKNTTGVGEQAVFVRNYTLGANPDRGSTDIELFGIHVSQNPNTGLEVLTGPGSAEFNRTNFTFDHLLIHHVLIENVGDEGFYIGYNNDKTVGGFAPFQIRGAKIYRNVIRNTQWDGLQVANCVEGLEVHDNHVTKTARARMASQQSSFQYNSGNSGFIYRNFFAGAGSDMQHGCTGGDTWFFDNVIDLDDAPAGGNAIYVHGGKSPDIDLRIFGNTFRARGGDGVAVNYSPAGSCDGVGIQLSSVRIVNNLFVFAGATSTPYRVAAGTAAPTVLTTPNLVRTEAAIGELCFKDAAAADYRIGCATSPALDGSGASLATVQIPTDALPLGLYTDQLGRAYTDAKNHGAFQSRSP
jgi:hypothetical protein